MDRKEISKRIKLAIFTFYSIGLQHSRMSDVVYFLLIIGELYTILVPTMIMIAISKPNDITLFSIGRYIDYMGIIGLNGYLTLQICFLLIILTAVSGFIFCFVKYLLMRKSTNNTSLLLNNKIDISINVSTLMLIQIIEKIMIFELFRLLLLFRNTRYIFRDMEQDGDSVNNIREETLFEGSQVFRYILIIVTILALTFLFGILLLTLIFGIDRRPDTRLSNSYQKISFNLLKLLFKIYLFSLILWDPKFSYPLIHTAIILSILILLFMMRIFYPPNKLYLLSYTTAFTEILLFGLYVYLLNSSINEISSLDSGGYGIVVLLMGLAILFSFPTLEKYVLQNSIKYLNKSSHCIHMVEQLINILYKLTDHRYYGYLFGLMASHAQHCPNEQCTSHSITSSPEDRMEGVSEEEMIGTLSNSIQERANASLFISLSDTTEKLKYAVKDTPILNFIDDLFIEITDRYPMVVEIKILHAYYSLYILGHSFATLRIISEAAEVKHSLRTEFDIFHLRRMIESSHMEGYNIAARNVSNFVDLVQVVAYQNAYNGCMQYIKQGIDISIDFWSLFLKLIVTPQEVSFKGNQLSAVKRKAVQEAENVFAIYPNNLHFLVRYMVFIKRIVHNEQLTLEIYDKIKIISDNDQVLKGGNEELSMTTLSRIVILKVSTERDSIGTITEASSDLEYLVGYTRTELLGQNVNLILPPPIAEHHNDYIIRLLDTMSFRSLYINIPAFVHHKEGFYVPININIKVLPYFEAQKFRFFGLISERFSQIAIAGVKANLKKRSMVMLTDSEGFIFGATDNCRRYFDISPTLFEDRNNKININQIITLLHDSRFLADISRDQGVLFYLAQKDLEQFTSKYEENCELYSEHEVIGDELKFLLWGRIAVWRFGYQQCGHGGIQIFTFVMITNDEERKHIEELMSGDLGLHRLVQSEETEYVSQDYYDGDMVEDAFLMSVDDGTASIMTFTSDKKDAFDYKENLVDRYASHIVKVLKLFIILCMVLLVGLNIGGYAIITQKMRVVIGNFDVLIHVTNRLDEGLLTNMNFIMLLRHILDIDLYYSDNTQELVNSPKLLSEYAMYLDVASYTMSNIKLHQNSIEEIVFSLDDELVSVEQELVTMIRLAEGGGVEEKIVQLKNLVQIMINKITMVIDELGEGLEKVYTECSGDDMCEFNRGSYFIIENGYEILRKKLDEAIETYLEVFLSKSDTEKIINISILSASMVFTVISCLAVFVKAINVIKYKSHVFSCFSYIEKKDILTIIQQTQTLDIHAVTFRSKYLRSKKELTKLFEGEIKKRLWGERDLRELRERDLRDERSSIYRGLGVREESHQPLSPQPLIDSSEDDISCEAVSQGGVSQGGVSQGGVSKGGSRPIDKSSSKSLSGAVPEGGSPGQNGKLSVADRGAAGKLREERLHEQLMKTDTKLLRRILLLIILILLLFLIFFGTHLMYLLNFFKAYEISSDVANYLSNRFISMAFPNVMINYALYKEDTSDLLLEDGKFSANYYFERSMDVETQLLQFEKDNPDIFSNFIDLLKSMNTKKFVDIMEQKGAYKWGKWNDCRNNWNGIYAQGLRTGVVSFNGYMRSFRKLLLTVDLQDNRQFYEQFAMNLEYKDAVKFGFFCCMSAMDLLKDEFAEDAKSYFQNSLEIEISYFLTHFVLVVLVYFFLFSRIITRLRAEIFNSLEIQNLIPLEIVVVNPIMKKMFSKE